MTSQNGIQRAAAEAIKAHETARAAYLAAAESNPWPEDDAPDSEWDAHDERDEAIRAPFGLDALSSARFEAEMALIRWASRAMGLDPVEMGEKAAQYPDLRRKLAASALRL